MQLAPRRRRLPCSPCASKASPHHLVQAGSGACSLAAQRKRRACCESSPPPPPPPRTGPLRAPCPSYPCGPARPPPSSPFTNQHRPPSRTRPRSHAPGLVLQWRHYVPVDANGIYNSMQRHVMPKPIATLCMSGSLSVSRASCWVDVRHPIQNVPPPAPAKAARAACARSHQAA